MICEKQTKWEFAVEYAITMGLLIIKHYMVREKSVKILPRKIHFDGYALLLQRFITVVTPKLTTRPQICNVKCIDEILET